MPFERRDYVRERFTRDELAGVLRDAGLTPRDVLSTRSRAYKDLGLAERALDDEELLDLIVDEPTLLRRPLTVGDGWTAVGFDRSALGRLAERANPTSVSKPGAE